MYAFLANQKVTGGRPEDEHRFQIKYGGDLSGSLDVGIDPTGLITTIMIGIDPDRDLFVAVDPRMNTPAPMSRSVEFKARHVERIKDVGWCAWERVRRPAKSKGRRAYQLDDDARIEVVIGAQKQRLLDLIAFEQIAAGLDPGERHLLADQVFAQKCDAPDEALPHDLLKELDVPPDALFDLIEGASRLKMAVRGWVAESHLERWLRGLQGVTECQRQDIEGAPDITLRWKGGPPFQIECKNTLRQPYADGMPKVDFQRTRASKGDPCSRYYAPGDFPVLAACLHAVTAKWEFRFALTLELPPHKKCKGRIANMVRVAEPTFTSDPSILFDKCSQSH
ncbi:hypothetical protein [Lutibaculum baratangense]|uniref:hypothetical protein n=1 Tax=Lutibaculum baratangense TaxID=1358440 RepID=UPI00190FAEB5|nr:hypothetical protein [Lutibaculum baratangense]